jgi:hypothetical protein
LEGTVSATTPSAIDSPWMRICSSRAESHGLGSMPRSAPKTSHTRR